MYEDIQYNQYDNIIAIGRGGSIIAAYLASKLGIPTFYPLFLRHIDQSYKRGKRSIQEISPTVRDQVKSLKGSLLIVDDYLREGLALKYVLDLISINASAETLVMYSSKASEFKPNIVGKYSEDSEISFPYDIF